MSWDGYIDNTIANTADKCGITNADKVAIIGLDGGGHWTTNAHQNHLSISPEEAQLIAKCMKNKDYKEFETTGIFLGGLKYQFLRTEEGMVLGKKKDHGAISLMPSVTAIIIAHVIEGCQHGEVNKGILKIADYLTSLNM